MSYRRVTLTAKVVVMLRTLTVNETMSDTDVAKAILAYEQHLNDSSFASEEGIRIAPRFHFSLTSKYWKV